MKYPCHGDIGQIKFMLGPDIYDDKKHTCLQNCLHRFSFRFLVKCIVNYHLAKGAQHDNMSIELVRQCLLCTESRAALELCARQRSPRHMFKLVE
jgi:hypothetical protein